MYRPTVPSEVRFLGVSRIAVLDLNSVLVFVNVFIMSSQSFFVFVSPLAHTTMVFICCQISTCHIYTLCILVFMYRFTVPSGVRFLGVSRIAVLDLNSALVFVNV